MNLLLPERLETERLVLRKPRSEDVSTIFAGYAQDPEVVRYLTWRPHARLEDTETFIAGCITAWEEGSRFPYVLALCGDELRPIGVLEARISGHKVDIGYVLERRHWRRGLMSEAVRMLADTALAIPEVFRLQATCNVGNLASARTLEKAGFTCEGRLERCTIHPNLSLEPAASYLYARCK